MHGWGGNFINFESSSLALSKHFTCVNVSFFDVLEACPLKLDDYVDFVTGIIIKLKKSGVSHVTAVGHSFGGRVCIRLASNGLVDKIMLIDSAGLKPKVRFKHILLRSIYKLRKMFRLSTKNCGSNDYKILPDVRKRTFNNIIKEYQDQEIKNIKIPCLIFWGSKDKDTPLYMAKKLNKSIAGSGLYIVKGGGHYSYLDEYKTFLIALETFINS